MNLDNYFTNASGGIIGALFIFGIIILMIVLVMCILYAIGRWKLYKKAGKNGWEAIIPFYNDWVYVEIAGLNWWWYLIVIATTVVNILNQVADVFNGIASISSLISLFGLFVCNYNISKKLNKDVTLAILMTLFPFIMIPLIGFSDNYNWDNRVVVSCNGPFDNTNSNNQQSNGYVNNNPDNNSYFHDNCEYKYCSNCGYKSKKDTKYCTNCGKRM